MSRFANAIGFGKDSSYGRARRGNVGPLIAQTLGNAIVPGLGSLAGYLWGRHDDKVDRRNHVPYSPDPSAQGNIGDSLGLMNWGGYASPAGMYGPMAGGYAGLPASSPDMTNTYDPNAASNIVNGYLPTDTTPAYNGPIPIPGMPVYSGAFGNNSGVFDNGGYTGVNGSSAMGAINGYGASSGMASRMEGLKSGSGPAIRSPKKDDGPVDVR